jgi:hypothetical protein
MTAKSANEQGLAFHSFVRPIWSVHSHAHFIYSRLSASAQVFWDKTSKSITLTMEGFRLGTRMREVEVGCGCEVEEADAENVITTANFDHYNKLKMAAEKVRTSVTLSATFPSLLDTLRAPVGGFSSERLFRSLMSTFEHEF